MVYQFSGNCSDVSYVDNILRSLPESDNIEIDMEDISIITGFEAWLWNLCYYPESAKIAKFFRKSPQNNEILQTHQNQNLQRKWYWYLILEPDEIIW